MADTTPSLALPLIAAGQAQKHVTHNEALALLDALVQLAVLDKDRTAPPPDPTEGDRYLIAASDPSGAWAGWAGRIARFQDGAWLALRPRAGWLAWVADEADLYTFTGTVWMSFRGTLDALNDLSRLGIGTGADADNPFAAKLNKALWTARTTAEGGSGDLRYTLNKQAPGNVLSLLMQSGWSGRAEIGLTGDDDLRVKVSPDGGRWFEALRIAGATGDVAFPGRVTVAGVPLPTGQVIAGNIGDNAVDAGVTRYFSHALFGGHPSEVCLPGGAKGAVQEPAHRDATGSGCGPALDLHTAETVRRHRADLHDFRRRQGSGRSRQRCRLRRPRALVPQGRVKRRRALHGQRPVLAVLRKPRLRPRHETSAAPSMPGRTTRPGRIARRALRKPRTSAPCRPRRGARPVLHPR
ncbi:DUF2793 domain-containing protein [Methylobacterium sp. B4]|uniref:DUF2793 domain-containing protein n=1 Tax=Methylobacterium sp. B4 TaxID=1938755 RepID=UPI000D978CB6|nr:DUF2793 domain-containing protein [Methylobacterium sp. B4]PXW66023.1 uncharacterized protein DUF2793 [Methylobacterium sp. B4]